MDSENVEREKLECIGNVESVELKTGERFCVAFHRHGSVGEDAEFEITNPTVIAHEDTESVYLHPESMKPGWTGGDAERCKWIFVALRPGTSDLIIRDMFRGEVESERTVNIVVTA